MTFFAFILIFLSIFLHALWHFISKAQKPYMAFFLTVSAGSMITTAPFAWTHGADFASLPVMCYVFAALGGFSGAFCNAGLSLAYRNADVSLAYPMARALPVLFTALVTSLSGFGKTLGPITILGMVIVMIGCLMMPLASFHQVKWENYWNRGLLGIVLAAVGTTGYTIFDSRGMELMKMYGHSLNTTFDACSYSFLRESFLFVFLWVFILTIPHERVHFSWSLFKHLPGYVAGVIAAIAYLLILVAMLHVNNVSYVQVFRQMSLPVGVLLGVVFLHEKCHLPKFLGMVLIVIGLIITSLY